jgi:hypothetical protein
MSLFRGLLRWITGAPSPRAYVEPLCNADSLDPSEHPYKNLIACHELGVVTDAGEHSLLCRWTDQCVTCGKLFERIGTMPRQDEDFKRDSDGWPLHFNGERMKEAPQGRPAGGAAYDGETQEQKNARTWIDRLP